MKSLCIVASKIVDTYGAFYLAPGSTLLCSLPGHSSLPHLVAGTTNYSRHRSRLPAGHEPGAHLRQGACRHHLLSSCRGTCSVPPITTWWRWCRASPDRPAWYRQPGGTRGAGHGAGDVLAPTCWRCPTRLEEHGLLEAVAQRLFSGYRAAWADRDRRAISADALEEERMTAGRLRGTVRLADLLTHLYVLDPARRHRCRRRRAGGCRGAARLAGGAPRARADNGRYLKRRRLVRAALERLVAEEAAPEDDAEDRG